MTPWHLPAMEKLPVEEMDRQAFKYLQSVL